MNSEGAVDLEYVRHERCGILDVFFFLLLLELPGGGVSRNPLLNGCANGIAFA